MVPADRTRTVDLSLTRTLLYHLSYAGEKRPLRQRQMKDQFVLARTAPWKTTPVVLGASVKGSVVAAIAAAFIAMKTHAFGAEPSVADHEIVQVVVEAEPIVMLPAWFVLPATTAPFVVAPQAPLAIVGKPADVTNCADVETVLAIVLGVVLPIGPGAASRVVKPAPETAPVAESVVALTGAGVVAPIVMLSIVPAAAGFVVGAVNGKTWSPIDVKKVLFAAKAAIVAARSAAAAGRRSFLISSPRGRRSGACEPNR